ncbi:MAG: ComF family protein [Verrucomicrobiaceae bacterium]|nr:MAG: ComF family protein [Verrucomicrobiaceae bacterium]
MKLGEIKSRFAEFAKRSGSGLLSLLYPPHCAVCKVDTESGIHLCTECGKGARPIKDPFCERCSQPFDGAITGKFICSNCTDRTFHFECAVAPFLSRGPVREFIHRFKYNRHLYLRHQLVNWMERGLADERLLRNPADALVPVPLHSARQREREFNQAEMLAKLLSKRSGIPLSTCLQRIRYTTTQTRLDRHERMENLRGAFRVRNTPTVTGSHLILIDDVFTTGSTVEECARVLRAAGAASVRVLTVARG